MTDKGVLYQKMIQRYHWPLSKKIMLLTQSARFDPKWTLNGPTNRNIGQIKSVVQTYFFKFDFSVENMQTNGTISLLLI